MFADRLNEVCRLLDTAGNTELAAAMTCKPTYVSLFRRGKRVPARGSRASERLSRGLLSLSEEKDKKDALCRLIDVPVSCEKAALLSALEDYLLRDEAPQPQKKAGRKANTSPEDAARLGSRLNLVMELLDISGAHLCRLAEVDASILSRWKNGRRIPVSDPGILMRVSRCLCRQALSKDRLLPLAELTGISFKELEDPQRSPEALSAWLSDPVSAGAAAVENFLMKLSGMPAPVMPPLPEILPGNDPENKTYRGMSGLQSAVLRFLRACAAAKTPALLLYSDLDISWMIRDPEFNRQWSSLMAACILNGTRIRIIHNINRGLTKMTSAIGSWLPLYMTGAIEGWYCARENGHRFSHTLFLAPAAAVIHGWSAGDGVQNAVFHYETDPEALSEYAQLYRGLTAVSRPLIRINTHPADVLSFTPSEGKKFQAVWRTLPLSAMSPDLASRVAARITPDSTAREIFLSDWQSARDMLLTCLDNGSVREFISLPPMPPAKEKMPLDYSRGTLFYSSADYAEHWQCIRNLMERRPNYRPVLMPEPPFSNVNLFLTEDGITIFRTHPSVSVFTVTHPLMQAAFSAYMERLRERSRSESGACTEKMEALVRQLSSLKEPAPAEP